MDGADELPSPFSRRYVMATEKQRGHDITTGEAHASITISCTTKDAVVVSRVHSCCSPFLAPTTNHSIVKRGGGINTGHQK